MRCAIFGCNVDDQAKAARKGEVMFFRFPRDPETRKAWQEACGRKNDFNLANARICWQHFKDSDYARNLKHELLGYKPRSCRLIKADAVPTEHLPGQTSTYSAARSVASIKKGRQRRVDKGNCVYPVDPLEIKDEEQQNIATENGSDTDTAEFETSVKHEGNFNNTKDTGSNPKIDDRHKLINTLENKIKYLEGEVDAVQRIFTLEQLRKLKNPKGRMDWSNDAISDAIVIYSAGPQAYRILLKKGYPFPAVSTLITWFKKNKTSLISS